MTSTTTTTTTPTPTPTPTRAAIVTVAGGVNSGKSSILDRFRNTNIVSSEEGKITQRTGVTHMTKEKLAELTKGINNKDLAPTDMLFIDTPGHDSFSTQRINAVGMSDLVLVIVEILKGVEKQTIECIKLLKKNKTPFIIVLNKLDTVSGWKSTDGATLKVAFAEQDKEIIRRLDDYINKIIVQVAENSMNAAAYYKNTDMKGFINLIPVSTKTGTGFPDLLALINLLSSKFLTKKLQIKPNQTDGFIVEKIRDIHQGEVISIILTNGKLTKDSTIITLSNHNEVIETKIKQLLIPYENKEIKDKLNLKGVDHVDASLSLVIKVENMNLRTGSRFFCPTSRDDAATIKKLLEQELTVSDTTKTFTSTGIFLHAQTSGMADALYNICQSEKIAVAGITIGPITKLHIIKAETVLSNITTATEDDRIYNKRYAIILAFGIDVINNNNNNSTNNNNNNNNGIDKMKTPVTVLQDDVIYKLIEKYKKCIKELDEQIKKRHPTLGPPCQMKILEQYIFMKKNPIIFGVLVNKHTIKKGMFIEAVLRTDKTKLLLGQVTSIQKNKKAVDEGGEQDEVCLKIEPGTGSKYEYGKDFDNTCLLRTYYSKEDRALLKKYDYIFA